MILVSLSVYTLRSILLMRIVYLFTSLLLLLLAVSCEKEVITPRCSRRSTGS